MVANSILDGRVRLDLNGGDALDTVSFTGEYPAWSIHDTYMTHGMTWRDTQIRLRVKQRVLLTGDGSS